MADRMRRAGLSLDDHLSDEERVAAYGVAVHEAVAAAPTLPRAEETLRCARQARSVYISSNTPVASLNELVRRRGWLPLVDAVYGYPRRKVDTVRQIVADDCGGRGDLVLVVGDGMSDEAAARENGCVFVAVDARMGLTPVLNLLEASDVPG
jgi:phosphoglycolate phosphatase-like HAD superfamily hydrolase